MQRRTLLKVGASGAAVGLLPLLSGCSSKDGGSEESRAMSLTYAAPLTLAAAPSYVAREHDLWKRYGLDVTVELFDSGRQALDALLGGQADVMSVSETPPVTAAVQGRSLRWIGTGAAHSEAKFTYRSDVLEDASDLDGRTLATLPGTNSDYFMYLYLQDVGVSLDAVQIISMKPPEMIQALVQGDVDGIFAWEPHNYNAYSQLPDKMANAPNDLYKGFHCIIASAEISDEPDGRAAAFLAGLRDAVSMIKDDEPAARSIVSDVTGLPIDALEQLWVEYDFAVALPKGLRPLLEEQAAWVANQAKMDAPQMTPLVVDGPILEMNEL